MDSITHFEGRLKINFDKIVDSNKTILHIMGNVINSEDLNIELEQDINEIHIICDDLLIDFDLHQSYSEKNVFIAAGVINVSKKCVWNLSGKNATQFGEDGRNGGNCKINYDEIINPEFWKIISNGGNGSNGQNGDDGVDGQSGNKVQSDSFTLLGQKVTKSNYLELLKKIGFDVETKSQRIFFYENGMEKVIIFNKSTSEMLMLIKGSKGMPGTLGGIGGRGGSGGLAGKVNGISNVIAINGIDGNDGLSGYNGRNGVDGRDAFMIIHDYDVEVFYGGLNRNSKMEIAESSLSVDDSIFFEPRNKFFYVNTIHDIHETFERSRNSLENQSARFENDKKAFLDALIKVLRLANQHLPKLIKELKINELINQEIDVKLFSRTILEYSYDIREYNTLKHYATIFTSRNLDCVTEMLEMLKKLLLKKITTTKNGTICEIEKGVITSELINSHFLKNFDELKVKCDVFHINTDLSEHFRGKGLGIRANLVIVHQKVYWDLSGCHKISDWKEIPKQDLFGQGLNGKNGIDGEDGGSIALYCNSIINSSFLTINVNGGNGSNGQNGGNGLDAVDGTKPILTDFLIHGKDIDGEFLKTITHWRTIKENFLEKQIFVENLNKFLVLIKGSQGKQRMKGGKGGQGGFGGHAGEIKLEISANGNHFEGQQIAMEGTNGKDGKSGKNGNFEYLNGCDAFLYVENGNKTYFGLDKFYIYQIWGSEHRRDYSVFIKGRYFYPKRTHIMTNLLVKSIEINYFENLLSVLRNSFTLFDELVRKIQLPEFVSNQISLQDVAAKVIKNQFGIAHYSELKRLSLKYQFESVFTSNAIRQKIGEFLQPDQPNKSSILSNTIEFKQKIILSSNLTSKKFNPQIKEFHIICDKFHINSDLSMQFREKNLVIVTNFLEIHCPCNWDLSGLSVDVKPFGKLGQDENGKGVDGEDGMAGRNGGNLILNCKFIENGSALTIISKGSNGTDGQNGGDGKDGKNGRDATEDDFKIGNCVFKKPLNLEEYRRSESFRLQFNEKEAFNKGTYISKNGLHAEFYLSNATLICLVKGEKAGKGTFGGIGGYEGDPGFGGEIILNCQSNDTNLINKEEGKGLAGKCGINGYNGIQGKEGRDIWKFDYSAYRKSNIYGTDKQVKYRFVREYSSNVWRILSFGLNQVLGEKIYSTEEKCYIKVEESCAVSYPNSRRCRNDSTLARSKREHAIAKMNASVDFKAIEQKSTEYVNESMEEIFHDTSLQEEQQATTSFTRIRSERKSKIDSLTRGLDKFDDNYLSTISELSNDEQEKLIDKFKISTTRQVTHDKKKKKKNQRKFQKITRKPFENINYQMIKSENVTKTASECFEYLRHSKLSADQYISIVKSLQNLNIQQNEYTFEFNIEALETLKELIIEEYESDSEDIEQSEQLEYYINDIISNSPINFLNHLLQCLTNKSKMELNDIQNLCEEKYIQIFYANIYKTFNKLKQPFDKTNPISFSSADFLDQFQFLKSSNVKKIPFNVLETYFNATSEEQKHELIDYFDTNWKFLQYSFSESLFNLLINCRDEFIEIHNLLEKFYLKANAIDEDFTSQAQKLREDNESLDNDSFLSLKSSKKAEFMCLLKEFFTNKDIIKFIKKDIRNNGINSSIFRRILAYKHNFKFVICRKNLSSKLKICEWHNYGDDLRFEYEEALVHIPKETEEIKNIPYDDEKLLKISQIDEKTPQSNKSGFLSQAMSYGKSFFSKKEKPIEQTLVDQQEQSDETSTIDNNKEIFILAEDEHYSFLNFEHKKYSNFKIKKNIDQIFKEIVVIMQNLHNKFYIENSRFVNQENLNAMRELFKKFKIEKNKFIDIFDTDNLTDDENLLYESVISHFPQFYLKIESNELLEFVNENSSEVEHLYPKNEEQERARIKRLFMLIAKIGGTSILKAIATRLYNDANIQNLEEFLIILKAIFELLHKNEGFSTTLTFMILGNAQEMWTTEVILLKLDSVLGEINNSIRNKWKNIFESNKLSSILPIFLDKILSLNKFQSNQSDMYIDDFDCIIENINYFDESMRENLMDTDLNIWGLITTNKYWTVNLEELKKHQKIFNTNFDEVKRLFEDLFNKHGIKIRKMMEIVLKNKTVITDVDLKTFLSNFNTGKWLIGDHIFSILRKNPVNQWIKKIDEYFNSEKELRDAEKIADIIKNNDDTSQNIKEKVDLIKSQVKEVTKHFKRFDRYNEDELMEWIRCQAIPTETELLAAISKVFKLKIGFPLRDTQLISVLTMCNSNDSVLLQVSTGEGKTFIAVAFAVLKVLQQQKIDIVTSSNVLAQRDAVDKDNKKIFDFFQIKVDHNCYDNTERRKLSYKCDIIYGTLCNFQRDFLLTEFHEQKLMTDNHFERIILIDEVDSMLLDKGNNILYLSQDLPNLDEIECIFIFIWQWINQSYSNIEDASKIFDTDLIRKIVLDNIYGSLDEDDIKNMESDVDAEKIINIMKSLKVIDDENLIQEENFNIGEISSKLADFSENLVERIKNYLVDKIEKDNQMKLPKHLKPFILQHLNQWIENGVRALFLKNGKEYVIDKPNTGMIEEHLDVNIIDLDTGTDMKNSQWDEGLHQFLQIRYGCKLSPISLKSVFISNVTFFKKYSNLYGMTGTLGSLQEREKMIKLHKIDFVTVPRFISRNYEEYIPYVRNDEKEWIECICEEIEIMCMNNRAILVICETIEDTRILEKAIKKVEEVKKLFLYQRDSDVLDINELESGFVIISTNLAGRGTDFKLSNLLKDFGGLHVILTNLPDNLRIEEQAFGRAARSGDKGSGRLIIYTKEDTPITKLKEVRNQDELKRLDEVSKYYENFITIEEELALKFQEAYAELKKNLSSNEKIYLSNFVTRWSFWLDKNSKLLDDWKNTNKRSILLNNFKIFLDQKKDLHPVMRIELFKEIVGKGSKSLSYIKKEYNRATKILSEDFHNDLFVHQYYQLYGLLRKNQADNDFKPRELTKEEHIKIRKCIKMLQSSINNRQMKIEVVKYLKEKYQEGSPENGGFEAQQKEILQIYDEILRSLRSTLGEDINPDVLNLTEIDKDVMRNELYRELLKQNCITYPHISNFLCTESIKTISEDHNINFNDLNKFLQSKRNTTIKSINSFQNEIREAFPMPSRAEFWDELLNLKLLTNEVEYATVNMNILNNVDPSARELIKQLIANEESFVVSPSKIYFAFINENENADSKTTMKLSLLKSALSSKRFDYLMENNVIEINKEATFDIEKFKEIRSKKIFNKYDEIQKEDFKNICKNYERIIIKLLNPEINLLLPRTDASFALNYENMINISDPCDLEEDYVYQSKIYDLIKFKFSYRYAIETLADDIINGTVNPIIRLEISPHLNLINDLMLNLIIEQSKVDETEIENCENIFKNSTLVDMFKNAGLDDSNIIYTLMHYDFIDHNYSIKKFDINNAKLPSKYQHIESTIKLLLQNRRILRENTKNIKNHLKNFVKPLLNKELERLEVVLVPIENFLKDNKFIGFMDLKGLGAVIKVQQQMYSSQFWKRFICVLAIALFQIIAGAAITFLTKGLALKFGSTLINEGVGDAIFALSSLQTGYFSWSDYRKHKMTSVATSVLLFAGEFGFSKLKWFKKASDVPKTCVTEIGAKIGGTISNKTGIQLLNSTNKEIVKAATVKIMKETAFKTVISCKNVLIQAGVGMAADYVIKEFLNQITIKIGEEVTSIISKDFVTHSISSTIDDMLYFFESANLQKLIMEKFQKLKEASEWYANIYTQISSFVDSIVRSDHNTYRVVTFVTSAMTKVISLGLVTNFVRGMYDNLNDSLKEVLRTKREKDKLNFPSKIDSDKVKTEILNQLKQEAAIQYRNSINANIVKPALVYAGTAIIKKSLKGIETVVKNSIKNRKEAKLTERTHKLIETINELKKSKNITEIPEDLLKEAVKIQMKTKNPETFKEIMKENTPLDEIGIECTRIAMENELGQNFMFVVKHKGVEHNFGNTKEKCTIINLHLDNGHFVNKSTETTGKNCLFYAINEEFKELSKKFTPDKLRNAAADVIDSNEKVRLTIENNDKEFYHQIGFFGGDQSQRIRRKSAGTYDELRKDSKNFKDDSIKYNAHHAPTYSGLKGTVFEDTKGKEYAILVTENEHKNFSSSGYTSESIKYKEVEKKYLDQKRYVDALLLSFIDMHNTKHAMTNENPNKENHNMSQEFDDLHTSFKNYVTLIHEREITLTIKTPKKHFKKEVKISETDIQYAFKTIDDMSKHKNMFYEPKDMKYVPGIPHRKLPTLKQSQGKVKTPANESVKQKKNKDSYF